MANKSKKLLLFLGLALVLFLLLPHPAAHADNVLTRAASKAASAAISTLGNISFTVVSKAFFAITYLLVMIGGVFVAIAAWGVSVLLQINTGLVNSNVVQFGFPVTLAIANLGFVLAIIVIAIATILRQQSYGIKSMLYKVVIMAVLVNFGLVLAGGILNFSDTLSTSFLEQISPAGSGNGYNNFASSLAGAFNPQKAFLFGMNTPTSTTADVDLISKVGTSYGQMLIPIVGSLFALASIVIILISLVALIVMLVIRYVFLGILLILLPIAWMMFVFPTFKKHYDSWWTHFLKYAFFPPIVLFFLWLGIKVSESMANGAAGTFNLTIYQSTSSNVLWATVANLLSSLATPLLTSFMQTVMLGGIMIGGLFAANSMGIKFADTGMKWAKSAKDGVLGYTGRVTRRAITAPIRGQKTQEAAARWMTSGNYFQRLAGRGLAAYGRVGGKNLVAEYEKKYSDKDMPQLLEQLRADPLGHNPQSRAALLNLIQKKGKGKIQGKLTDTGAVVGGLSQEEISKYIVGKEDVFKNIGSSVLYGDLNTAIGGGADQAVAENAEAADSNAAAAAALDSVVKKLGDGLGKGGISKVDLQNLFSGKATFGLSEKGAMNLAKAWMRYMAGNNPAMFGAGLSGVSGGGSLDRYQKFYGEAVKKEVSSLEAQLASARTDEEKNEISAKIKRLDDSFKKSLLNYATYGSGETEGGGKDEGGKGGGEKGGGEKPSDKK